MSQPRGVYIHDDAPDRVKQSGGFLDPSQIVWDRPADRVRGAAETNYNRVRDDTSLNPQAAQARLAKAYLEARTQMQTIATQGTAHRAAEIAALKRQAYGIDDLVNNASPAERAAMSMSYRDAQARAAQATDSAQARALLAQAEDTGDELLARAVGSRVQTLGMADVAEQYLAARPQIAAAIERAQELTTQIPTAADLFEYVAPKPIELSSMHESAIERLAAEA